MKPTLQLKLSQHLALTPQLQQSIRLLQLSTLELNQELEKYLTENPLLEREDEDFDGPSGPAAGEGSDSAAPDPAGTTPRETERGEDDSREHGEPGESAETGIRASDEGNALAAGEDDGWYAEGSYPSASRDEEDDSDYQDIQAASTSLRDHLAWQLGLTPLSDRDRNLVRFLIEALDDDGYLTQPLEELADALPPELEIDLDDLLIALRHLQHFDPTGVGARSPQECLALQLEALPPEPTRDLALQLVRQYLELLAGRDFTKLKKLLGCDDDQLRAAAHLVKSLNPRPGAQYAPLDTRYIIPDVVVRKLRNQWVASINPDAYPRLRINRLYSDILSKHRGSSLAGQLQEARWLIKNVQQRFDTILRVSQAIVERQRQFFEHGEVAMRPLVLREIAEVLGLHESTVSRVTTQKYMATPRGIFELKYFFGSHVATEAGGACSATAIRALIKQLIGGEDAKKPLSDSQISEILGQQGIVVARRTIAKYREALNIPPANLRKTI
ncbi:RNA polymerase factor sigma-54 [Azospira inquinata]|uniref:RNA polymerase sigma-54 factor n=1 Tax=Azospira inquinata TaxID=2785627 RepID=A0A975XTH0_9RHOO|nr:RNA polymerase factor sigma-54 [Azospira inquinata]QWT46944.1 RNA polymerase factor sigma-54 [Azospira inquinata]QWT47732.1 RNA polymerase factor sigma-54 [Azospira inquinata]